MSILIKGLKLPPVGIRQCIVSFADNCLLITDVCGKILFEGEYVEVPTPHGRLIDENELLRHKYGFSQTARVIIKTTDAVIEAEVSGE